MSALPNKALSSVDEVQEGEEPGVDDDEQCGGVASHGVGSWGWG